MYTVSTAMQMCVSVCNSLKRCCDWYVSEDVGVSLPFFGNVGFMLDYASGLIVYNYKLGKTKEYFPTREMKPRMKSCSEFHKY